MANAAPVCYYQSSEVVRGHADTYISAANPAVGDYIGTMQEFRVRTHCQFDHYGSSWTSPSWTVTTKRTPNLYRVYRTGTLVPGTFNAAIWVHMVYR